MTPSETFLVVANVISLLVGLYAGYQFGFNYGNMLGRAREFVHFTVAIEKAFADKTKAEFADILEKVSKEYDILVKKDKH